MENYIESKRKRLKKHFKKIKNNCDKCCYCQAMDDGFDFSGGSEWYECRRFPPNDLKNIDLKDGLAYTKYPNVSLDDWCGEFKPAGTIK